MIRRMVGVRRVSPRGRIPITIVNVKPYHIIMCGTKIYCDGECGLPLVFDTYDLAELCIQERAF
jgi:hypothetical protein